MEGILSLIKKLCSLLVIVPGNIDQRVAYFPRRILSLFGSKPWITPRLRVGVLCAIGLLSATLSQKTLPYHASNKEVMTNDLVFFGDHSYYLELASVSGLALNNMIYGVQQEPYRAVQEVWRSKLATAF